METEVTTDQTHAHYSRPPEVTLWSDLHGRGEYEKCGSEQTATYGAEACFSEKTSIELYKEDLESKTPEQLDAVVERMMEETSGRGHGSVLDQSAFTFVFKGLPRLVTFQLCLPEYLMHLQQSLRRAVAKRDFYIPEAILNSEFAEEVIRTLNESYDLYVNMKEAGVPAEDARIILPLFTRTNIQTTGNARELMNLHGMSREDHMPSIIRNVVEEMILKTREIAPALMQERETNYEPIAWYPSPQLFAPENELLRLTILEKGNGEIALVGKEEDSFVIDESIITEGIKRRDRAVLSMLQHLHYTFLVKMSLMTFHQAERQRTWNQSVESIYDAVERGDFLISPSIRRSEWLQRYQDQPVKMIALYHKLVEAGIPKQEAIGVVPHSIMVYDLIHINGWNAIYSVGKRTCLEAQWEIVNLCRKMAELLKPRLKFLEKFVQPQCVVLGRCPEKHSCGLYEKLEARLEP